MTDAIQGLEFRYKTLANANAIFQHRFHPSVSYATFKDALEALAINGGWLIGETWTPACRVFQIEALR